MKNTQWIVTIVMMAGFSVPALAEKITKEAYKAAEMQADTDYKAAKAKCDSFSANAKDICLAEAKGAESVAKADAEAKYKDTEKARFHALKAKVDAEYKVAKERCDDLSGNKKDVCRQEAKAEKVSGEEKAKLAKKTAEATSEFMSTKDKAHQQAGEANRDAEYSVALEKCEQFAGDAKDQCITAAKSQFEK
ncbi:hypothetical protein WDW86_10770 [Bdellovibrionota bacterium FG-2]